MTEKLTIDAHLIDGGHNHGSAENFVHLIVSKTLESWQSGADIVLFPEFMWLNLALHQEAILDQSAFADFFWHDVWPLLQSSLPHQDKIAFLGSITARTEQGLVNRAILYNAGEFIFYDKICPTPAELDAGFKPGKQLCTLLYRGLRIVPLICFDVEIPSIVTAMHETIQPDLILVASATETGLGAERIRRCASARAIELGCAVVTTALLGAQDHDFFGSNVGTTGCYLPALQAFQHITREEYGDIQTHGNHVARYTIDAALLHAAKTVDDQPNPATIKNMFL